MALKVAGWSSFLMLVLGLFVLASDVVAGGVVAAGGAGVVELGERAAANVTIGSAAGRLASSSSSGMACVSAPSTTHASVTFDGYDVSTGTAATSLQSAGFAYVSAPLATGASAKSDSNYVSSGTGSTNLAATTNTAKPLVMRAALDPILSSMASLFTTLPTTTTTTLPAAAATTGLSTFGDETPQLSDHDFRTVQIAVGVGLPVFVFLAILLGCWLDRKDQPQPMHRAWPDDAYTGRGGFELRQWRRIPGETPNVERKGWRKFFAWWKK